MKCLYICSECGRSYPIETGRYTCDDCSANQRPDRPIRGMLEVRLEDPLPPSWQVLLEGRTWKAPPDPLDLLPIPRNFFPPIPVGNTPLWQPRRLREILKLEELYLKDDSVNPTGSLKDRASYLVAAFAAMQGLNRVVLASTGNAGSSMAGVAAAAGLAVTLFLPRGAPQAKRVQALQYGAELVEVDGSYDEAYDRSLDYLADKGGLSRNTAHNPLTVEGKKTVALEIFLQLGRPPDRLYVPVGDGVILSAVYKGFEDLLSFGLIERMPLVLGCQASLSSAIARALEAGDFADPLPSTTAADSVNVDVPRGGYYALGRLRRHGGRVLVLGEDEIFKAQSTLARYSGLFAEPAAALSFAGLLADPEPPGSRETVVLLITGNGLKDPGSLQEGGT